MTGGGLYWKASPRPTVVLEEEKEEKEEEDIHILLREEAIRKC
jgi:hypothetical protein